MQAQHSAYEQQWHARSEAFWNTAPHPPCVLPTVLPENTNAWCSSGTAAAGWGRVRGRLPLAVPQPGTRTQPSCPAVEQQQEQSAIFTSHLPLVTAQMLVRMGAFTRLSPHRDIFVLEECGGFAAAFLEHRQRLAQHSPSPPGQGSVEGSPALVWQDPAACWMLSCCPCVVQRSISRSHALRWGERS